MQMPWTRREFVGRSLLAAGVGWQGAAGGRAAAVAIPPVTPEAEILGRVTPRRPLKGGPIPRDLAHRLGSAHVAGRYHFTGKPFLLEGAERIQAFGLGGIKLWLANVERSYSFNSDWKLPANHTLKELAEHPYFAAALALPFSTIALEIMPVRSPQQAGGGVDLLDPRHDVSTEENQIHELVTHLLRTYGDREVTFLLQNWEGDWMFRGAAREDWMRGQYPRLAERVAGFGRWFTARQRGVERARAAFKTTRCKVFHAVEVNRVFDLLRGIPTLTTHVLPQIRPDFISWSCYDGLNAGARSADKSAVGLWQGLELIQHYARTTQRDSAGRPAVYIGEIGIPENQTPPEAVLEMMDGAIGALLARDVSHILHWEVFCNERKDGTRPRPSAPEKAEELRGFWLVRPDGSTGVIGNYFQQLLAHAGERLPANPGPGEAR